MNYLQAAQLREMHALRARRYGEEIHADLCKASRAALLRTKESYLRVAKDKLAYLRRFFDGNPSRAFLDLAALEATLNVVEAKALALRSSQAKLLAAAEALLSMPLARQCAAIGVRLEYIRLDYSTEGWVLDGVAYKSPEAAAFAHFQAHGYVGTNAEGKGILALMKCACLDLLGKHIPSDRGDVYTRYFEAQSEIMWEHADEIVACIRAASDEAVERNVSRFLSAVAGHGLYPEMSKDGLLALWRAIGPARLADLALTFLQDPYGFRGGWPALALVKEDQVRFVEVKTTDRLNSEQRNTICDLLLPNGANVSVLRISASRRIAPVAATSLPRQLSGTPSALPRARLASGDDQRPRSREYA